MLRLSWSTVKFMDLLLIMVLTLAAAAVTLQVRRRHADEREVRESWTRAL